MTAPLTESTRCHQRRNACPDCEWASLVAVEYPILPGWSMWVLSCPSCGWSDMERERALRGYGVGMLDQLLRELGSRGEVTG
jgi:hypothetical protein